MQDLTPDADFIKTELPTILDYDPTPHIEAKMQKLNQQEPDEIEGNDNAEARRPAADLSPYLVNVVEGVQ